MTPPVRDETDRLWDALNSIDKRLQALDSRFADIQASVAEIRAIYGSHHERLDRVEKTLYGNGSSKGLIVQVGIISAVIYGILFVAREILAKLL